MFKIGHYTDIKNITGCTVILCPSNTVASCYISGSSPGSRETALLAPERKINFIHAILLSGGSAFGLDAAGGVVQYLEEKNLGYETQYGVVPIVPTAVIFDLNIGNKNIRPTAANAYEACLQADNNFKKQGSIGAGTGATVGKWEGMSNAMKSGIGIAEIMVAGAWVRAISVVNAVGDIIDDRGNIVAGAINSDNKFLADIDVSKRWLTSTLGFKDNTVLVVIMTNVKMTKLQAYVLSQKAHNGLVRAIIPANTNYDGDVIFTLASGAKDLNTNILYEIASEVVRNSIIAGVLNATSLGEFNSKSDIIENK
jgi:L-aminopeptidase/D-esterase-like protein